MISSSQQGLLALPTQTPSHSSELFASSINMKSYDDDTGEGGLIRVEYGRPNNRSGWGNLFFGSGRAVKGIGCGDAIQGVIAFGFLVGLLDASSATCVCKSIFQWLRYFNNFIFRFKGVPQVYFVSQ